MKNLCARSISYPRGYQSSTFLYPILVSNAVKMEVGRMVLLAWSALLVGGVLAGAGLVAMLVLPTRIDMAAAAVPVLGVLAAVWGFQLIAGDPLAPASGAVFAVLLAAGAAGGGYFLSAALLPTLAPFSPRRDGAAVVSPAAARDIRVVLVCCAEDERYSAAAVLRTIEELHASDAPAPPDYLLPFVCASEKARYRVFGPSPSRSQCRLVRTHLERVLGDAAVDLAWCNGGEHPADLLLRLEEDRLRRVVVLPLMAAGSRLMDEVRREVDGLRMDGRGVEVLHAPTLWSSLRLAERLVERALSDLRDVPLGTVGVVLALEGQPYQWDEADPQHSEQETFLAQRVRSLLEDAGIDGDRVRIGWLEWREPDVTDAVRHLAAVGCTAITVLPVTAAVDSLSTIADLPQEVVQARVEDGVRVSVLSGWGDDDVVVGALAATVRQTLTEG